MKLQRNKITAIISVSITLLMLYFIFSTVDFAEVVELARRIDLNLLAAFLLTSLCMSLFSTLRYKLLLSCLDTAVPTFSMYLTVLVRNLGSDLLPARIGTFVYVWLANTRLAVPLHAALSSFGYALIFDIIAMCPLIMLAALFVGHEQQVSPEILILLASALLAIVSFIAIFGLKIFDFLYAKFYTKIGLETQKLVNKTRADIDIVASKGQLIPVLALSVLIRIFKYLGLYLFLLALLIPTGYEVSELPFAKIFLAMSVAEFSSSLPISGIAGLGTYQGAWIAAFSMLGFSLEEAKLTSISHHLLTQFYGYSLGLLALGILMLPFMRRKAGGEKAQALFGFRQCAFWVVIILICYGLLISFLLPQSHTLAQGNSSTAKVVIDERLKNLIPKGHALIFDSNRSGTFGIYQLNPSSGEISTLIDDAKRHEMFPSISSNQSSIVFASAKGAGRYAKSRIEIFDLKTQQKTVLSENGTFPSFLDANTIIFERDRKLIIKLDLRSKQEEIVFPRPGVDKFSAAVVKPRVSPDGVKFVFTSDKTERWGVWMFDSLSGNVSRISEGCQPSFFDNNSLVFIRNKEVKAGSGIFKYQLGEGLEILLDQNGPQGHEYFPNIQQGILLFSAGSEEDHSHESGKYGLFLKDFKSGELVKVLSDGRTNRWATLIKLD